MLGCQGASPLETYSGGRQRACRGKLTDIQLRLVIERVSEICAENSHFNLLPEIRKINCRQDRYLRLRTPRARS
jgi:hypothetical protein